MTARTAELAAPVPDPNRVAPLAVGVTRMDRALYVASVAGLGILLLSSRFVYVRASGLQWTMAVVASAICGAGWIVARSYPGVAAARRSLPSTPCEA